MAQINPMLVPDRFKLGTFSSNCSGGMSITKAPERWSASWDDNLRLAQMCDAAGLDFMRPTAATVICIGRLSFRPNSNSRFRRLLGFRRIAPDFFQLIKLPDLGLEQIDDDIAGVDQHPVAIAQPLDRDRGEALGFQGFAEMLCHGGDVALRGARRNNHIIGKIGFTGKIDDVGF